MGTIHKASPDTKFTKVSNDLIRDMNVTDSAYRFICWVFSHKDGFSISFAGIKKAFGYGVDKIKTVVKNAEVNDYLVRIKTQRPGTGLFDWDYYVFPTKEECLEFRRERGLPLGNQGGIIQGVVNPPLVEPPYGDSPPHNKNSFLEKTNNLEKDNIQKREGACDDFEEVSDLVPEEIDWDAIEKEVSQDSSSNVSVKEEVTSTTSQLIHEDTIPAAPDSFKKSEQSKYEEIEDIDNLPVMPNGKKRLPWENSGRSPNNKYDEGFAEWLYDTQLKRYTGFTKEGYPQNKAVVRGYFMKAHVDYVRLEKLAASWNDYVNLVAAPPKPQTSSDSPLESFVRRCGDKLRAIVLEGNFNPEQLKAMAEIFEACDQEEELTILTLQRVKLIA